MKLTRWISLTALLFLGLAASSCTAPGRSGNVVACSGCAAAPAMGSDCATECEGEAKDSGKCDASQATMECCQLTGGAPAKTCADCGEIKGSEGCCDENAKRCASCDKIKGSPGCCK